MPNTLASATSPYLRQHADNPVHWQQWTAEALAQAAERDVPILLSIGYAACHWCHVMAHESFEDPEVAAAANADFVCIKVDREERPDLDAVYMNATVALTGQGGWPMTCFLTPDRRPFFCGTYYPKRNFVELLATVAATWCTRRAEVEEASHRIADELRSMASGLPGGGPPLTSAMCDDAVAAVLRDEDVVNGGFGSAPKFPPSALLEALLRNHERTGADAPLSVVARAGHAMARGGLHDQLAGGFARYSVDASWVVPHFEKMLYDNAQLLRVYAHWARCTRDPLALKVTDATARFMLDEMRSAGMFVSSLTAEALLLAAHLAPADRAPRYRTAADATLAAATVLLARAPRGSGHWLAVAEAAIRGPIQVAVACDPVASELLDAAHRLAPGGAVVIGGPVNSAELLTDRPRAAGSDAAYVCRGSVCDLPVTTVADLAAALGHSV